MADLPIRLLRVPSDKVIYAAWDRIEAAVRRASASLPITTVEYLAARAEPTTWFRNVMRELAAQKRRRKRRGR